MIPRIEWIKGARFIFPPEYVNFVYRELDFGLFTIILWKGSYWDKLVA